MEKHLEALKAQLDSLSVGMAPGRSFKTNAEAFKAASVAFHEFLRDGISECGGDGEYYFEDVNLHATDIQYAFEAAEDAADAREPYEAPYSTLNHAAQGIVRGANLQAQ